MNVPDNITGNGYEIFSSQTGIWVTHHGEMKNCLPKTVVKKLNEFIDECPERKQAYKEMNQANPLRQCVQCMFSMLDGTPDIDENGTITPEIVECEKRGSCKWEGIGCLKPETKPIDRLSRAQKRVVVLIDMPAKLIADTLCLSERTVVNHIQEAKRILGAKNKTELAQMLN